MGRGGYTKGPPPEGGIKLLQKYLRLWNRKYWDILIWRHTLDSPVHRLLISTDGTLTFFWVLSWHTCSHSDFLNDWTNFPLLLGRDPLFIWHVFERLHYHEMILLPCTYIMASAQSQDRVTICCLAKHYHKLCTHAIHNLSYVCYFLVNCQVCCYCTDVQVILSAVNWKTILITIKNPLYTLLYTNYCMYVDRLL